MKTRASGSIRVYHPSFTSAHLNNTLFEGYRRGLILLDVFRRLLGSIKRGTFKPYFKAGEIDRLFEAEVLKVYADGRYSNQKALNSFDNWRDLMNNIAAVAVSNYNFILEDKDAPADMRQDAFVDMRKAVRQLKIIEDWIFHTPGAQALIQQVIIEKEDAISR